MLLKGCNLFSCDVKELKIQYINKKVILTPRSCFIKDNLVLSNLKGYNQNFNNAKTENV